MSQTYGLPPPPTRRLKLLLLVTWGVLTLAALAFALVFGTNAPYADEWEFVPALLGHESLGSWLWGQHNEHRLPLSRGIYYLLFQFTHDFRSGSIVQVAMLSALALVLMRLAERLRGKPEWADVFFPVSLLHLGHWENFVMGYQLCFVLFCVLVTGLVVLALQTTRETAFSSGFLGGILLLLIALTGGFGLVMVPPIATWLVYLAVLVWRTGARGRALILVGLAVLAVAYLLIYFVGYERPPRHDPPSRDPIVISRVAGQVLAMALGVGVTPFWWAVFAGELLLGLATVVHLLQEGKNPANRPASAGLIAVAVGVAGLAVAIGAGRGSMGLDGLWSRYSLLTWPLLAAAYLTWVKAGRKWIPAGLCVVAAMTFLPNEGTGMMVGSGIRNHYAAIEFDVQAGRSAEQIVRRRFPESPNAGQMDRAIRSIPLLQAAGTGIFGHSSGGLDLRLFVGVAIVVVGVFAGRWLWQLCKAVQSERARELFRLQHERFEEALLKAAAATGLPRGLRWMTCQITGDAVLVRDVAKGMIVALVPVTIQFEPVEGSDMEDVPAAREPRPATAVFTFSHGTWETVGRVVFNHTPEQAIAAFAPQFRIIHHGHH